MPVQLQSPPHSETVLSPHSPRSHRGTHGLGDERGLLSDREQT